MNNILKLILHQNSISIKGRLVFNMSWALIGSVFSRSLLMFANILFARILGAALLGEMGIIQNTITVFVVIASSGVSIGITKFVAEMRSKNPQKIKKYIKTGLLFELVFGIIGVCILIPLSTIISKNLSSTTDISLKLILFSFTILFVSINTVQIAALAGMEKFQVIAAINVLRGLLVLGFGVIGSLKYSINGALIGLESAELITMAISFFWLRKASQSIKYTEIIYIEADPFWEIIKFSWPIMLGSVITMASFWYCSYLLTQSKGFESMGIFNAAEKWRQLLFFIPTALSPTILPILSNLPNKDGYYKKVYYTNLILNTVIIVIPAALMIIFAKFAMALYGLEFILGTNVLIFLILSAIFSMLNSIFGQSLYSLGLIKTRLVLDIFLSILLVGGSILLIPLYGTEGLALDYLAAYFVTSLLVFWVTQRSLKKEGLI